LTPSQLYIRIDKLPALERARIPTSQCHAFGVVV